jgi:histidinol-phosphate/aromatic aminotransferase/cobyric acid decarboxylase-like protein
MLINEITFLDQIFELEKKKKNLDHIDITNISHWNPSHSYKQYIERYIKLDFHQDIFDYVYTYDLTQNQRIQIMQKLGVQNPKDSMCLLNSTGTSTIINLINFLKLHNYRKLGILTPSYFSVEQSCKICNLTYEKIPLEYFHGKYFIPLQKILENYYDVIWLTSPVYSTGISFDSAELKQLICNDLCQE